MSSTLVAVLAIVTTSSAAEPGDAPRRPDPPPAPRVMPKPAPPRRASPPPAPRPPDPPPAPKASPVVAAEVSKTDHESVVERIGVGWFGVSNVMVGTDGETLVAPTLGARYWIDSGLGVDAAIGLTVGTSGGERTTPVSTTDVEGPNVFGILGHLGLPLAFHSSEHYTFLVIPEVNIGYGRIKDTVGGGTSEERVQTGVRFEVGARAGAEIQFGFIGVPELALEASVGVRLAHQRLRRSVGDADVLRLSATGLSTLSVNDPWDFFRSTVAARYYF